MKSAFVTLAARPSAGKSTLVNSLCGGKVSITSPAPQTTRNTIRGIVNRPAGQLVLLDTPGRHISEAPLNRRLMQSADRALSSADLTLYILDLTRSPGLEEERITEKLAALPSPIVAALNKTDLLPPARLEEALKEAREFLAAKLPALPENRVFALSALTGNGLDALLDALFSLAPEGPLWYGSDCYTDQDVRFRCAELIRGAALPFLREELPHSLFVDVTDVSLKGGEGGGRKTLVIQACLYVERESQKGMVVGKGGSVIGAIRVAALKDMKRVFDWNIDLTLRVKTAPNWRKNEVFLKKLIA